MRLEVRTDRIVRVSSVDDGNLDLPKSIMVVESTAQPSDFKVEKRDGEVVLTTAHIIATVSLANGAVRFTDISGKPLLAEEPPHAGEGRVAAIQCGHRRSFLRLRPASVRQMNLNGEDVELSQHNMDIAVPFVVSTRNYGVLWDNNGISRIGNPEPYGLASRDLQDARRERRRFYRALFHRGQHEARARREGHQLPVHPRPLQLAEGIARAEGAGKGRRRLTSCLTSR